jgi:hypothetical protein
MTTPEVASTSAWETESWLSQDNIAKLGWMGRHEGLHRGCQEHEPLPNHHHSHDFHHQEHGGEEKPLQQAIIIVLDWIESFDVKKMAATVKVK